MERREGSDLPGGPGLRLGVAPDAVTPSRRPTAPHPLPPEGGRLPAGGTGSRQRLEPAEHPPHGTQLLGPPPPHHRLELVDLHAFRRRGVRLGLEGLAHRPLDPRVERHPGPLGRRDRLGPHLLVHARDRPALAARHAEHLPRLIHGPHGTSVTAGWKDLAVQWFGRTLQPTWRWM